MARRIRSQQIQVSAVGQPFSTPFSDPVVARRAPTTADLGYDIGQTWVNTVTNQAWIMTGAAAGAAVWSLASPGASDVDTINGLSPALGNIVIAGGTNLTDVNGGNTVTLNLDPAITLATSVTSPIYTSAAALAINAPAGQNITMKMGDAAGVNKVSFVDSASAEVFAIDSNGGIGALAGLTVTGALTQTAGVVNIGQDNAVNAINIGGGTAARAIGIGNSAAAHTLTLGSTNTTASTILQSGTGDLVLTSTDEVTLDSVGVLELNSSAGVIGIGNDAVAQAINIGTGAAARTVTLGNIIGASAVNVNTGTGGSAITTTDGTFAVATGTGAINVGVDAVAHTITLGNIIGATAVNINAGTGGTAITTTNGTLALASGTGAINIGTDAVAHTLTLGNAIGATSVVVDGGTGAMQFGANAIAHATTIGSVVGAASTTLQSGTGDLILTSTDEITADSVGVLELNSSGAAIGIGTDANAFAINIGTSGVRTVTVGNGSGASSTIVNSGTGAASFAANATDHTTTVGSTVGVSATVIQSGSGKIDLAGVVGELTADFVDVSGDKITFRASPIAQSTLSSCIIPTGVAATTDLLAFENGIIMEQFIIGTQTILAPRMGAAALGLTVSADLTNAEGKEISFGATRVNSKHSFTIGTSPAFYMQLRFTCNDVSSVEPAYFGFRQTEANNASYAAYNEFCLYGLNDGVSPGDCAISTRKAAGAQVDTDTNDAWADTTTHTLRINVSAAGVTTFLYDGSAPTVTQAFTFTNGIVVHPFWSHLFNATVGVGDEIYWISMEVGFQ
jgi:hypothetical protein